MKFIVTIKFTICSTGVKGVFRLRGNNVQLVKSVAQPDGKAKNVGAGSINLVTGKENFNEEVKLTEADKAEIKEWH